jgi:phenylacetate-CoA ligase
MTLHNAETYSTGHENIPAELRAFQLDRLNQILPVIQAQNPFWKTRLKHLKLPLTSWEPWESIPFTSKEDLSAVAADDPTSLLTFPYKQYTRIHRTSGTRGSPICVLDTQDDWQWWARSWQYTLDAAHVTSEDRAALAFSFGPFIGFWSAHEALSQRGTLLIPTGGMSSPARLEFFESAKPTILLATPTYALRLMEVARELGKSCQQIGIRKIIVAGEPGGSIPSIRQKLESGWGAHVIDHAGATEIGPWGVGNPTGTGLHVIETEFIAEFLPLTPADSSGSSQPPTGDTSRQPNTDRSIPYELVLTALGRTGWPAIRYRTGDLVFPARSDRRSETDKRHDNVTSREDPQGRGTTPQTFPWPVSSFVQLVGGILGRADEMWIVRGMNVFPSAIDAVLSELDGVGEYRIVVARRGSMDEITVRVEDALHAPARIASRLQQALGLRIEVEEIAGGTFEKFEGKARRVLDERSPNTN